MKIKASENQTRDRCRVGRRRGIVRATHENSKYMQRQR